MTARKYHGDQLLPSRARPPLKRANLPTPVEGNRMKALDRGFESPAIAAPP